MLIRKFCGSTRAKLIKSKFNVLFVMLTSENVQDVVLKASYSVMYGKRKTVCFTRIFLLDYVILINLTSPFFIKGCLVYLFILDIILLEIPVV